jgi:hypothetical protein
MSKFTKFVAVLFIIAMVFGCASSKSSTTAAAGAEQKPTGAPSGTIHWEGKEFMAILEGQWGHGTLAYNGKVYKFKTSGLGAGGLGGQKISATGEVYNLKDISDFPGKYVEGRGGLTGAKGIAYAWVENGKKVSIHIKALTEGLALTLGVEDFLVELVDEK